MAKRRRKTNGSFWSSGTKKRRSSDTRNKSDEDYSGVGCLVLLAIVIWGAAQVIEYLGDLFGTIGDKVKNMNFSFLKPLIAGLIIGVIVVKIFIAAVKSDRAEERRMKRAEKKDSKAFLRTAEIKPEIPVVSSLTNFGSKEEEAVNLAFRNYVVKTDEFIRDKMHLD